MARYKVKDEEDKDDDKDGERGKIDTAPQDDGDMKKPLVARIVDRLSKYDEKLERAQPGESTVKTRLYSVIWTPQRQLGDFGLGMFRT